jgi:tetratricopeptide (TPR) repeat protein
VIPVLEELGDDRGLARAYVTLGWRHFWAGQAAEQYRNAARALEHARRGDDRRLQAEALAGMVRALVFGRTPWRHVERFVAERVAPERERLGPRGAILGVPTLADAAVAQGRFDEARELYARARAHFERQGWRLAVMTLANQTGPAELLAGDFAAAERELRAGYNALGRIGEDGYRSMITALLAEAVLEQGRTEEALRLAEEAYELAGAAGADFSTLVVVQFVRARVASARGDHDEAIAAARNAVKLVGATDFTTAQADARRVLGEVLVAAGSAGDAADALGEALALYERKGSAALAERTRALLTRCCGAVLDTSA